MDQPSRVSIVVAARNASRDIPDLLDSFLALDYPHEFLEIVCVDDDSEDDTTKAVKEYSSQLNIKIIRTQQKSGPSSARNLGALEATGDILAFTDSDCIVPKDWLRIVQDVFRNNPHIHAVTGPCKSFSRKSIVGKCEAMEMESHYRALKDGLVESGSFFRGGNLVIRKSVFACLGGFNEKLKTAEDHEFGQRLLCNGYKGYYSRDAWVYHKWKENLHDLFKQHFRYGRGDGLIFKSYPGCVPRRLLAFALALFFFVLSFVAFWTLFSPLTALEIAVFTSFSYFLFIWWFKRSLLKQANNKERIIFPLMVMIKSTAWSVGFLEGNLIKFFKPT